MERGLFVVLRAGLPALLSHHGWRKSRRGGRPGAVAPRRGENGTVSTVDSKFGRLTQGEVKSLKVKGRRSLSSCPDNQAGRSEIRILRLSDFGSCDPMSWGSWILRLAEGSGGIGAGGARIRNGLASWPCGQCARDQSPGGGPALLPVSRMRGKLGFQVGCSWLSQLSILTDRVLAFSASSLIRFFASSWSSLRQ